MSGTVSRHLHGVLRWTDRSNAWHKLCREALIDALSPLGTLGNGVAGGEGAIYLWAQLPEGEQRA